MTINEFSNEFDSLLGSYLSSPDFGKTYGTQSIEFDEYEKSILLTEAQEELVLSIYNGKNLYNESFEETEETRSYLKNLIKTFKTSSKEDLESKISKSSVFFILPEDVWFITYESVNFEESSLGCVNKGNVRVVPTTQDTFTRTQSNPFRKPSTNRVLRLDAGANMVELVSEYEIKEYIVRYLAQPSPIILEDLPDGLTINNINSKTECKLNPVLHRVILENAVKKALESRVQYINKQK